ncbi:MAG: hypothetical protein IIB57_12585 [Planctomycetes bacterium]|nr:hypothetical protein [Planctomycetota bacterium]
MATSTPTELSFDTFPPLFPRRFLPESPDLTDRDQLVALYQSLLDRPIDSQEDLEAFLLDCSELNKAAYQAHAILSIRMRCQTDDKSRAEALKRFTEVVEPAVWPLEIEIDRKILDARTRFPAADDRYAVYIRRATTDVEIFRTENVDLAKQDDLIGQDYFALCGKMTFEHDGEEYPLPEATKFIKDPDRSLREKIWRAVAERYLRDREAFEEIFDQLVKLRHTIAKNADFPDYLAYTFEAKHRYDYTPADCEAFHDAVESCIVPAANEIYERRRDALGLDTLRPWDLSVDPLGREPDAINVGLNLFDKGAPLPVPVGADMLLEQYGNKSLFTGSPIESAGMMQLMLFMRRRSTTSRTMSEFAKLIRDVPGVPDAIKSPARAEALLRGLVGEMGMIGLAIADTALYPGGPTRKYSELPVFKRFYQEAGKYSKVSREFYERFDEFGEVHKSMTRMMQVGDVELYRQMMSDPETKMKFLMAGVYERTQLSIRVYTKKIDAIRDGQYDAIFKTGDQKRDEIDRLEQERRSLQRQINDMVKERERAARREKRK